MYTTRTCSRCAAFIKAKGRPTSLAYSTKPTITAAGEAGNRTIQTQSQHQKDGPREVQATDAGASGKADHEETTVASHQTRRRHLPIQRSTAFSKNLLVDSLPHSSQLDASSADNRVSNSITEAELRLAAELKKLDKKRISSTEKLQRFEATLYPYLKNMQGSIPRHIHVLSTTFFNTISADLAVAEKPGQCIKVIRMVSELGFRFEALASKVLFMFCDKLLHGKLDHQGRKRYLKEIWDMWKLCSQLERTSQFGRPLDFAFATEAEIKSDAETRIRAEEKRQLSSRNPGSGSPRPAGYPHALALASTLLQLPFHRALILVPALTLTMGILSDPRFTTPVQRRSSSDIILSFRAALPKKSLADDFFPSLFENMAIDEAKKARFIRYLAFQWPKISVIMGLESAASTKTIARGENNGSSATNIVSSFHKQLRQAYRSRNSAAIMALWEGLRMQIAQRPYIIDYLKKDSDFLDFWVFVWCAIRRPKRLQDVLEFMADHQITPTVKTYTAMMHGWKICKDVERIEGLWLRLSDSPITLDVVIWTERISALIEAGKPQSGIAALAEMLQLWKEDPEKAVKPTIEVVNAAVKGLLPIDANAAHDILSWASKEGIVPNIRTYNILLRETFRENPEKVPDVLKAMKAQGITPDSATFTIILEEDLSSMKDATGQEQVDAIEHVFADIQNAGLRPNLETYAKMLYAVTSLPHCSDEAVEAIQSHMRKNKISATPHMVTILIERALRREPRDINAVKQLLREHDLTDVSKGDQTLWERVMSAHAVTEDSKAAMFVFDELAAAGRPVTSLPCLTDLLKALLAAEERDQAARVVGVVLEHKTSSQEEHSNRNERYWKHHFWFLARENDLIEWEKAPADLKRGR